MSQSYEPLNIYCASCGAPARFDIAGQVYRCAYCGGETGIREPLAEKQGFRRAHRERLQAERQAFPLETARCTGCGAQVVFPEGEALTHCAFCGRSLVRRAYLGVEGFPEILIPFRITEDQARENLLAWCRKNRGRSEVRDIQKHLDEMKGFYLPYELVKGPVSCTISRLESKPFPCRGFWDGSFVNTSKQLDNLLLDGMEPYDLADVKEFDFSYLAGQRVQVRDTDENETAARVSGEIASKYRPFAARVMETRGVHVAAEAGNMVALSAVLPVYYLRAGDTLAAVNGQTGKVAVREKRQRHMAPWWIKPILSSIGFPALVYGIMRLLYAEQMACLLVAGVLAIFLLFVLFTAYHNAYGGMGREALPRRIFTSDDTRTTVSPPTFYLPIEGRDRAVDLRFTTPLRLLLMVLVPCVVVFLPVILAFILNGFDYHGLTMGGAAVWLCLGVPLAPVFVLKFGRLELYEHPVIRYCTDDGRRKRHRAPKKPWKARWRDIWDTVKVFVFSPLIFAILFGLIVLVVNTVLVLHWDSF